MATLTGILEWSARAEGRVRQLSGSTLVTTDDDPYVPLSLGERYALRHGLEVEVEVEMRKPRRRRGRGGRGGRNNQSQLKERPVVDEILSIEGVSPDQFGEDFIAFENLTSIDPAPRLTLEHKGGPVSARLIDMFCPIGRGQRGLIVSPPKAGKTTLLKDIGASILMNHSDVEVCVLLVDERPEEVTDFRRAFAKLPQAADPDHPERSRVVVMGSSNDHDVDQHIAVSMLAIERAKRRVEAGRHVVILLDSLTRLGRAFNRSRKHSSSGRTMSGGIDSKALEVPKQLFGAARNTEEAGSLTIIATCLVDTGSQGDQLIFEEFKGTGNMELVLDRKIAERRIFPAMNLAASGTRKEDLLIDKKALETINALRRRLLQMPPPQQMEQLLAAMDKLETNAQIVGS